MEILVATEPVDRETLAALAAAWHGSMVKGVADIERGTVALGGQWHMDANMKLMDEGSEQQNVWGFNLYPAEQGDAAIEYTSLINIRPRDGNRSLELKDEGKRAAIRRIAAKFVPFLGL